MLIAEEWLKTWICLSFLFAWARAARPRFDVSTDMGMVLVPADAEIGTAIFRLRATDQDADFPLIFEILGKSHEIKVRIENLPCTFYNKICQANVILTKRLVPGRLHDFIVRVRDSSGDMNSMQATISVTNATTLREKIFPHLPTLVMVSELFKIKQRQVGSQTKGVITLTGELDFETQSMYTLTMYATDPYTEPGKDTRNIAGINVVVAVVDVQDVPPIFTLAPPLTTINNTVRPGDVILRVHAEDGDKGVPRQVTYGLISEGNPFTPFFNVSESTGEIILARPLEELTKITHVGAPIILKIVAEEIRTTRDEPAAQASVVELGLLLGEPGNSPPYFENDNYVAWIDENAEPGTIIVFSDAYSTQVKDEDIGKAGVFALKLEGNNGTFEISPAVAERSASFVITVRDNSLIDYEKFKSLRFRIVAQEVGPATNLSTSIPVTIFLRDTNDNPPAFDATIYEATLSENASAGTKVVQVHATDKDSGVFGRVQYTKIIGSVSEGLQMNPDTGFITVSIGSFLDREQAAKLELTIEAKDEDGRGLRGVTNLIVNIIDINDNAPIFETAIYEFILNNELTNFTMSAFIKATDSDAEPPNNIVRYEIVHGNYDNKFQLNEITGQLVLREPITKIRKVRASQASNATWSNKSKLFRAAQIVPSNNQTNATTVTVNSITPSSFKDFHVLNNLTGLDDDKANQSRRRRAEDTPLFILTARAYDLGVPHRSSVTQIRVLRPMLAFARIVMFVMPGENPDPKKTAETLATITGSRVTIMEIKPYVAAQVDAGNADIGKRSVVVARVEQNGPGTLVDVDKIRASLAENGFGIISGMDGNENPTSGYETSSGSNIKDSGATSMNGEDVVRLSFIKVFARNEYYMILLQTVYKAENKLLTWLLILLGLLIFTALVTIILCCACSSCPFYMEPRKRRIHSSETLIIRSDARPKRHLHRKPMKTDEGYYKERKEAWSADPERQQWQFNRRNTNNLGISSLPGDVHQSAAEIERMRRATSLRQQYDAFGEPIPRVVPMNLGDERMYMEDMEVAQRNFEQAEMDSLRRHELERGSDGVLRNGAITAAAAAAARQERIREQHYYREGNAEVLKLVTRGEIEDRKEFADRPKDLYHANGKDILLQRFIEDQKLRRSQDLRDSPHEADVDRSMESHQRANEVTEILILPERLEMQRQPSYPQRSHDQTINVDVQRLIGEHPYKTRDDEADDYRSPRGVETSTRDAEVEAEIATSVHERNAPFGMHDAELVRQNVLLTRLLLEKEARNGLSAPVVDSSSFLETQSLPGQVAIATQTDRTASTQTECFFGRSRSDNEESEEDPRLRRKSKTTRGKLEAKEDLKQMKTIWVRTPIPEESRAESANKNTTPTRMKIKANESKKVSPDLPKEMSHSLDSDNNEAEHQETKRKTTTKKVKETRLEDDSTTPSPETKEKSTSLKSKVRKKPEKPPRRKLDSEKSHLMEPSFRVLEREISSFQQKIKDFGDKKLNLLKKDDSKREKESEDDSGATYDVSKKCEVTVKGSKKSVSRETSPKKISVEQKSKRNEEESKSRQNISSSDLEDSDKSRQQQPLTCSERTTQYESSRTEIRSRSQLRRQPNLENSDFAKSSSEKIEDNKSSSLDLKLDPTADFKKKQPRGKYLQSQRAATKRPLDAARQKVAAVKSRTIEQKSKRLTTASDESKLSSPVKKSASSEEDKSKTTSSSDDKSKLSTAIGIDIDKLVEDVREAVEKELQAAREAMIVGKLGESAADEKGDKVKNLSKLEESTAECKTDQVNTCSKSNETQGSPTKIKSQSLDKLKREMASIEKNRGHRSIEGKEKKEKSKSVSGISPTIAKTDEAVTFIVFENDKIRGEPSAKASRLTDIPSQDSTKPREPMRSIEIISKPLEMKSENVAEQKNDVVTKKTSERFDEMDKAVPDSIDETKRLMSSENENNKSEFDEAKEKISEKMTKAEDAVSEKSEETKHNIYDRADESKQNIGNEMEHTKQSVSNAIDNIKLSVFEQIDKGTRDISSSVEDTKQNASNVIDEAKENLSDNIGKTEQILSDVVQESVHGMPDIMDEAEQSVSDKAEQTVSSSVTNSKQSVSNKLQIGGIEIDSPDDIDEIGVNLSDAMGGAAQNISIVNEEASISDQLKHTVKSMPDEMKPAESDPTVTDEMSEAQKRTSDQIEEIARIEAICQESTVSNEISSSGIPSAAEQRKSGTSEPDKAATGATSDTKIEPECTVSKAYLCESTSASLPSEMREQEGSETIIDDSKSDKESASEQLTIKAQEANRKTGDEETNRSRVTTTVEKSIEETKRTERVEQSKSDVPSLNESQNIQVKPSKIERDKARLKIQRSRSPVKFFKPISPAVQVIATTNEDESDEESSSASDISNKTALQTSQPYRTPRHSISSDEKKPEPKARQRWDKEPLLKVEMPRPSKTNFPKKMEVSAIDKPSADQTTLSKAIAKEQVAAATGKSTTRATTKETEQAETKEITRPVVVGVKRKDHLRTDHFSRIADTRRSSPRHETGETQSRSNKVEIRSKHLKLQVSHHYRQAKDANVGDERETASQSTTTTTTATKVVEHGKEPEIANARSRYMAWYQQKRAETEVKRREKKEAEEQQTRIKWTKKPTVKSRKAKSAEDSDQNKANAKESLSRERAKSSSESAPSAATARISRLRVRPLVNVESEQLKAIVRQGRKLRKKEGGTDEDLTVQIFAPERPPPEKIEDERLTVALQLQPRHHLIQHSEYKYEKSVMPPTLPFYLHPPPAPPNPSPEMTIRILTFQDDSLDSRRLDDDLDSGIAVSLQNGTTRLKHQQVLEKKSVFDIAYNEAAPTQLRSDSSTPPS
ncbi:cadherin-86C [Phymastichus coffea]|uniref:cadherin-86C n=1 Tax=Phymastichus coffea TaxID=108790 RepID=UPI00273B8B15|nr:cadherin-86C [Phymastichus coffea]